MRAARKRQLLRGAEHAERLDAAQLPLLDLELALRDERANLRERRLETRAAVRRTAHNLHGLLAVRHLRNVHVVGVRVRLTGQHLAHHDLVAKRFRAGGFNALHLQTGPRQTLSELLGLQVVNLYILIQPTDRQLHSKALPS